MAQVDNVWYIDYGNGSSTGYYAITQWAASTTKVTSDIVRQLAAPAVGSERAFVCVSSTGGTGQTGGSEPAWNTNHGTTTTDNTVAWREITGVGALNGDKTNTPTWTSIKNTSIINGQVITSDNGNSILICTTAGTAGNGSEPSWAAFTNAGATTADNTVTWTTLKDSGNNFTSWSAPHARLANAFTAGWGLAGNSFFIASEHAETQATAITLSSPGTTSSLCYVYCVDKNNVPPTSSNLTTGATITTTGGNNLNIAIGYTYFYGLTFSGGSGAVGQGIVCGTSAAAWYRFDNCTIKAPGTTASTSKISFGSTGSGTANLVELNNTVLGFGSTGDAATLRATLVKWLNTANATSAGSTPTSIFSGATPVGGSTAILNGVELSTSTAMMGTNIATSQRTVTIGCRHASNAGNAQNNSGIETYTFASGNANSNYTFRYTTGPGRIAYEDSISRNGGSVTPNTAFTGNIAPLSWLMFGDDNTTQNRFESFPMVINNAVVGEDVTVTVYFGWDQSTTPQNDNIWMDVQYLGATSSPLATFATTGRASPLHSTTNYTTDAVSTWVNTPSPWSQFSMSVTIQPKQIGYIFVTLYMGTKVGVANYYIDPLPVLS